MAATDDHVASGHASLCLPPVLRSKPLGVSVREYQDRDRRAFVNVPDIGRDRKLFGWLLVGFSRQVDSAWISGGATDRTIEVP